MRRLLAPIALAATFVATPAAAAPLDPAPERLVLQPPGLPPGETCQSLAASPEAAVASGLDAAQRACLPAHDDYRKLVSQLSFALAAPHLHPAKTLGSAGIQLSLDASYVSLSPRSRALRDGTEGERRPDGSAATTNEDPDSFLQLYTLTARKGLPWGFEVGATAGHVMRTSSLVVGADVRWAVVEGLRHGKGRYVPDVSLGVGARTASFSTKLAISVVTFDLLASKSFVLADGVELTPIVGYGHVLAYSSSSLLDFTPNVDALARCGVADARGACSRTLPNGAPDDGDLQNFGRFPNQRIHRDRFQLGARYRYERVALGALLSGDLFDPSTFNPSLRTPRQWIIGLDLSLVF